MNEPVPLTMAETAIVLSRMATLLTAYERPDTDTLQAQAETWARTHLRPVFDDDAALRTMLEQRPPLWACLTLSTAAPAVVRLACRLNTWLFSLDDAVTHHHGLDVGDQQAHRTVRDLVAVVRGETPDADDHDGMLLHELRSALSAPVPIAQRRRFEDCFVDLPTGMAQETDERPDGTQRRHTVGVRHPLRARRVRPGPEPVRRVRATTTGATSTNSPWTSCRCNATSQVAPRKRRWRTSAPSSTTPNTTSSPTATPSSPVQPRTTRRCAPVWTRWACSWPATAAGDPVPRRRARVERPNVGTVGSAARPHRIHRRPTTPTGRQTMTKRVLLAAPRGFCAGVDRAVQVVELALARFGPPVYVRHEIVHNTHVIERLKAVGAVFTDDLDQVPEGARLVFSAHGISPAVREHAARRNLQVIDATCPLVSKVHAEARRYARDGHTIALIGHPDHVEIDGTRGHAPDQTHVINPDDPGPGVAALPADRDVAWLSQTTLAVEDVADAVAALRARFPTVIDPPSDDICYASTNRQAAVKAIAPRCELMLAVGSANSSNSRRLVEVALAAGAPSAHLLDHPAQLRDEWLDEVSTVGVTAGASAPEVLVTGLLAALADRGYDTVEPAIVALEDIQFVLPANVRR